MAGGAGAGGPADGLQARVDHLVAGLLVLGPVGDQPPAQELAAGLAFLRRRHCDDVVARRHVEPLADLDRLAEREARAELSWVGPGEREAPAHQPARALA